MRFLGLALAVSSLGLAASESAAATVPPPQFWSTARCERVLPQEHPAIVQAICVGTGGPSDCRWTSRHRARLYSKLRVFTWYRQRYVAADRMLDAGVVRAFTLGTRARTGFYRVYHHYGDQYAGQPADFFIAHAVDLATNKTPAQFRAFVAPLAARLLQQEPASCTGA